MRLPFASEVIIEKSKLVDYCLNIGHPIGKHKAQLFKSLLDLTVQDADELEDFIRKSVLETDYENGKIDQYGIRFIIDFKMTRLNRTAWIRTTWIILINEEIPRMTSCYIK